MQASRREDLRLITGQGRYATDWNLPQQLHAAVLRSARDVLLGIYRSNPKKAGDFGFTVNDSPRTSANSEASSSGNTHAAQPAPSK